MNANSNTQLPKDFTKIYRRKCKCGMNVYVYPKSKYRFCKNCGNIVFLDKKAEFDFKIKRRYGYASKSKNDS